MYSVSRESAEGGRVIVEVDDKVAKVRNIKVCFLSSSLSHIRILIFCTVLCLLGYWIILIEILREKFKPAQL